MLLRKRKVLDGTASNSKKVPIFGNHLSRKHLVFFALFLWLIITGALVISQWDVDEFKFGRTFGRSRNTPKKHHKHLLHKIHSRLAVFLASHAVWEDVINSYPSKQQKIWEAVLTDSDSDSDTDSEDEHYVRPKRYALRGKRFCYETTSKAAASSSCVKETNVGANTQINTPSEKILRRIVAHTKIIDSLPTDDIKLNSQKVTLSLHPVFQTIQDSVSHIPIPLMEFTQSMKGQVLENKHLVLFSNIPNFDFHTDLSFWNVYEFFDKVLEYTRSLQASHPQSIVIWFASSALFNYDQDLQCIFHHLLVHYLMEETGLIVVPPYLSSFDFAESKDSRNEISSHLLSALDQQLAFIYKRLILSEDRQDMHALEWQGDAVQLEFVAGTIRSILSTVDQDEAHQKNKKSIVSLHQHCFRYINTRKYDPLCMPEPENRYPLLVTGLGGSGSHFVANQLQEMGFQLRHEGIGKDGAVSWFYSVNDFLLGLQYPFGKLEPEKRSFLEPRFDHVIHVMRNPLDQISSFTAHTNKTYDFVMSVMQIEKKQNIDIIREFEQAHGKQSSCFRGGSCHLHFAVLTWIYWNKMVANYAEKSYHLEQVGHLMEDLCVLLWPEYNEIETRRRCPDERRIFLTSTWWKSLQYYWSRQFFPSYKSHKKHSHYSLDDIRRLHAGLEEILKESAENFDYRDRFL